MNSCGETGTPGDSLGGGAGVSSKVRIKAKKVLCGAGSEMRPEDTREAWLSHGAGWRVLASGDPGEGRDEGGYRSNSKCNNSMMSWRVAMSPGFLSEYRRDTSWAKGMGHKLRRAKQPMEDVENALKQRRSSCRS